MSDERTNEAYEPPQEPGPQAPPPEQGAPGPPPAGPPPAGWGRGYARDPSFGFDPRAKNAPLACFLSLMPGLGQIYVGAYQRGFMHILIVGSTIAILAAEPVPELTPLLGIFLPFFWLYNIIDAGRRAGMYNHALQAGGKLDLPEIGGASGSVLGGTILIAAGSILLSHTRFGMSMRWLEEWWPVAPIMLGAWLVLKAMASKAGAGDDA